MLGNDPLEPQFAGMLQQFLAIGFNGFGKLDGALLPFQQLLQHLSALVLAELGEIVTVEIEQIEGMAPLRQRILKMQSAGGIE